MKMRMLLLREWVSKIRLFSSSLKGWLKSMVSNVSLPCLGEVRPE